MRAVLIVTLFLCLVLPTTSPAREISDIVNALGTSTAEFQDNVKRLTGDSLEGHGMVLDVKKSGVASLFDVYILTGDKIGVVVVVPVRSTEIPFKSKQEVQFSGRIQSIAIREYRPGELYLLVMLSNGDVH